MALKITDKSIKKYVEDIMLDPSDKQILLMKKELSIIFDILDRNTGIDFKNIEPMNWIADFDSELRADDNPKCLEQSDILQNAPKTNGDFISINNKKEKQ